MQPNYLRVNFRPGYFSQQTVTNYLVLSTKKRLWQRAAIFWHYPTILFGCLLLLNTHSTAQTKRIYFNHEGKLLSAMPSIFEPGNSKKKGYTLEIVVSIPVNFLQEDLKGIDQTISDAKSALHDMSSALYLVLPDTTKEKLQAIFDSLRTNDANNQYVPENLFEYRSFTKALMDGEIASLNSTYKKYIPFRLSFNEQLLDTTTICNFFEKISDKDDSCKCIPQGNKINFVFRIPSALFQKVRQDSFSLQRIFPLKEITINYLNRILKENKNHIPYLKYFESLLEKHASEIEENSQRLEELRMLVKKCPDNTSCLSNNEKKRVQVLKKSIDSLQKLFNENFGDLPCKGCNDTAIKPNLMQCRTAVSEWLSRLVWLNGDKIRLNPFNFTSVNYIKTQKQHDKRSLETRIAFLDSSIVSLTNRSKDKSILTEKDILRELDTLLNLREQAYTDLENVGVQNTKANKANAFSMDALLTTQKTVYKGWLLPYSFEMDGQQPGKSLWVRNYYYNEQEGIRMGDKLHFYYPQNENVALLVHNVPADVTIAATESTGYFSDSAAFTVTAGQLIGQMASVYALVNGAPIKSLTSLLNQGKKLDESKNETGNHETAKVFNGQVATFVKKVSGGKFETSSISFNKKEKNNLTAEWRSKLAFQPMQLVSRDIKGSGRSPQIFELNGIKDNKLDAGLQNLTEQVLTAYYNQYLKTGSTNWEGLKSLSGKSLQINDSIVNKKILQDTTNKSVASQIKDKIEQQIVVKPLTTFLKLGDLPEVSYSTTNVSGEKFGEELSVLLNKQIRRLKAYLDSQSNPAKEKKDTIPVLCDDASTMNYIAAHLQMMNAQPVFTDTLVKKKDLLPSFRSFKHMLSEQEPPYKMGYKLAASSRSDSGTMIVKWTDSSNIKVSKFIYWQVTAGIGYTWNAGSITNIDTTNGGFKVNRDDNRFRFIAGFRFYPWGLYNQANPRSILKDQRWLHRLSVLVATGVPKPLENFYVGGGLDIVPGLNVNYGCHFQQQNKYRIQNNQVLQTSTSYQGQQFVALTMNPEVLVNAIKTIF